MEQNSEEPSKEDVEPFAGLAMVLQVLGTTVEDAHDNGEGHMTGDGKDGTGKGNGEAIGEDVFDVLKGCEAEGDEYGVNNAVELIVEVRILPGLAVEEEELCSFFYDSDNTEGEGHGVNRSFLVNLRGIQSVDADSFQEDGSKGGEDAHEQAGGEETNRLFISLVLLVDVNH